ncbi:MAG: HlyD family type I secretion periplasmic adaptor subunit [Alphaproteobacteria bacterium]|nr:HlyD family type I secretion periplasmic adaptor subunit [Alphaproteobacteria bacterium]
MSRLDELLDDFPLPTGRFRAWLIIVLLATLLVWSKFARLDEVASAEGEVVPQEQVKVVQHLEGGIIRDIFVREGDVVREGAPLILLELSTTALSPEEMRVKLDGLVLSKARLEAEASDAPLHFPKEEAERQPQLVEAERSAHEARTREHNSTVAVLEQQLRQKQSELRELEAKYNATASNLKLIRDRVAMSASLLKDNLTPKMEHLKLEGEEQALVGELATLAQSVPRLRSALAEVQERIKESGLSLRREALEELKQVETGIAATRQQLGKATEQQARTEVKSPIDGVVKNMRYHTLGGVVQAGEAILELVPTGSNLVIEAKLSPTDRGYVEAGQPAVVKISTYDYARYGGLAGKVTLVAPDSTTNPKGEPYFRVIVKPEKTYFGRKAGELVITPGMQAVVDIHIGTRTVMDYLLKPVLKLRDEAFHER